MRPEHKKVLQGIAKEAGITDERMEEVHAGIQAGVIAPLRAIIRKHFPEVDLRIEKGIFALITLNQALDALPHMLPEHMREFAVNSLTNSIASVSTALMTNEQLKVYEKMADAAADCIMFLSESREVGAVAEAVAGVKSPFDKLET